MGLKRRKNILASCATYLLASVALLASTSASADTYVGGQIVFEGANVYGASILVDGKYKMWHSAWQDGSTIEDTIYYRESTDNVNWSAARIVLTPNALAMALHPGPNTFSGQFIQGQRYTIMTPGSGASSFVYLGAPDNNAGTSFIANQSGFTTDGNAFRNVYINHVTDPSVTRHVNAVNGQVQYTMFFTVCVPNTCHVQTGNEIWSAVSNNGIDWLYPKPVISGPVVAASEPSAIIDPQPDGTFWKVYFDDRNDPEKGKVKLVTVNGNRDATATDYQTVFNFPGATVANPEVRYFNNQWHLFANVYGSALDSSGNAYTTTANIYKVTSSNNMSFPKTNPQLIVMNAGVPYCGSVAPGVQAAGGNQYDIYFGLIPNSAAGQACNMAANRYMVRYRFAE
ncbi:MAG: hypothetical protein HY254_08220 [Burkholderiales bacterium]|nr:hypothetical protein [Burkholderiales bacterium]